MKVGLIVTTYNWKDALRLVLESIKIQTQLPDEVIIADDGSRDDTAKLIKQYQENFPCPLKHAWQEDKGFRAAASRNNAILALGVDTEYVVLIDGDMILQPSFVEDHVFFAKENCFIQGSRALIKEQKTCQILNSTRLNLDFGFFSDGILKRKNTLRILWLAKFLAKSSKILKGIRICNMSFWKKDLSKVNGFNEDFVGWGREDTEIVVRLFNAGIMRNNLKFSALAYHLHHPENSRKSLPKNDVLLQNSVSNHLVYCNNGLEKNVE